MAKVKNTSTSCHGWRGSNCAACKQAKNNQTCELGASQAGKNNKLHVLVTTSRQKMKRQSACEACGSCKQKDQKNQSV